MTDADDELESFRRQWRAEVARNRPEPSSSASPFNELQSKKASQTAFAEPWRQGNGIKVEQSSDLITDFNFDHVAASSARPEQAAVRAETREPESALEHFEKAVERESQGDLGKSLRHYRQAYKLDDRVDQVYKNKRFPPSLKPSSAKSPVSKSIDREEEEEEVAVSSPQERSEGPLTLDEFLQACAGGSIFCSSTVADAAPRLSPIATLPSELLSDICVRVALHDPSGLARLSLVCKRLAWFIIHSDHIWKVLSTSSAYGFNAMRFDYSHRLRNARIGTEIAPDDVNLPNFSGLSLYDSQIVQPCLQLPLSPSYPTYRAMFRNRPRIRFAGIYISTSNYTRQGEASLTQTTWNAPIHVITYYRYLRFYRDGSCISLVTSTEPLDVVPHFRRENLPGPGSTSRSAPVLPAFPPPPANAGSSAASAPPIFAGNIMKQALRGRWRMSPLQHSDVNNPLSKDRASDDTEPEGHVYVETAGPTPAYTYHLQLALRSIGSQGTRNTKLAWRGFWSHNRMTDDWAEFQLQHDRAFVWSRVKSWADT